MVSFTIRNGQSWQTQRAPTSFLVNALTLYQLVYSDAPFYTTMPLANQLQYPLLANTRPSRTFDHDYRGTTENRPSLVGALIVTRYQ